MAQRQVFVRPQEAQRRPLGDAYPIRPGARPTIADPLCACPYSHADHVHCLPRPGHAGSNQPIYSLCASAVQARVRPPPEFIPLQPSPASGFLSFRSPCQSYSCSCHIVLMYSNHSGCSDRPHAHLLTPSTAAQDIPTRDENPSRLLRRLPQRHPPCQWARLVFFAVCVVCHLDG